MSMMNKPTKIILHCAASEDSLKTKFSFEACKRYHVEERGWRDIGYHFYITRDGEVHKGREFNEVGAHCKGQNDKSIGVCYEGSHFPTVIQIDALCNLYRTFKNVYKLDDWHGHYEYTNKECPGFDIEDLKLIFKKLA